MCIQDEGSIPFKSATVHPKVSLYFDKIENNASSRENVSEDYTIIGKVSFSPKKTYFK